MSGEEMEFQKDIDEIARQFKANVKLEDKTFRLKKYKQVFVGSDAVDYLVNSGAATSREDAVALGKALQELSIFEHVFRDHTFKDEALFYRFVEENERGAHKVDENTGQRMSWTTFLGGESISSGGDDSTKSRQPKIPQPDLAALNPNDVHVASHVWPMDSHNTTLLDHVHPPEWRDPAAHNKDGSSSYDLICIGAGVGGLVSAAGAAGVGAKVAMIEANMLGGDCLNVGCVVRSLLFVRSYYPSLVTLSSLLCLCLCNSTLDSIS